MAEIRTAIKSAVATLLGFKDDQGEPMNNAATGLVAVVPPVTHLDFLEAINATIISNTSNVLQGAARVLVFPRITAASVFYLLKTDVADAASALLAQSASSSRTAPRWSSTPWNKTARPAS